MGKKMFSLALVMGGFVTFLLPQAAYAHSVVMGGFPQGFWHPVLGLDHLLAMVSVGIVSAQLGGRAIWTVPTTFVFSMIAGGFMGMHIPEEIWMNWNVVGFIELGIAASVFLLGTAIALNRHMYVILVMAFVSLFGLCHGFAHGIEIPDLAISWAYIAGFVLATSLLHILGVSIGLMSSRITQGSTVLRYMGAVVSGMGLHIVLQMFGY